MPFESDKRARKASKDPGVISAKSSNRSSPQLYRRCQQEKRVLGRGGIIHISIEHEPSLPAQEAQKMKKAYRIQHRLVQAA